MTDQPVKKKLGFALISPERRREIATLGGKAVPASKRAFFVNRRLAAEAGHKGGVNVPADKRAYSVDPTLAGRSGTKGGAAVPPQSRSFFTDRELAARAGNASAKKREALKAASAAARIAPKSD